MEAEAGLLGASDPPPVRLLCPEGASDFFLTADHAGRAIPQGLASLGLPDSELARHIACDIGIAELTEALSARLDAAAVLQRNSRLVIDCNRNPEWPSSIPEISETTVIPGNQRLSAGDRGAAPRGVLALSPEIAELLNARAAAGRRTVLVAMHSFTPVFKGVARPMHVGVLYNRDPLLPHILLELLRGERGLVVGDNQPYAISDDSDYTAPAHAERRGLPYVEIEIRQHLIGDAKGQLEWAERLARLLPIADEKLRAAGR